MSFTAYILVMSVLCFIIFKCMKNEEALIRLENNIIDCIVAYRSEKRQRKMKIIKIEKNSSSTGGKNIA